MNPKDFYFHVMNAAELDMGDFDAVAIFVSKRFFDRNGHLDDQAADQVAPLLGAAFSPIDEASFEVDFGAGGFADVRAVRAHLEAMGFEYSDELGVFLEAVD